METEDSHPQSLEPEAVVSPVVATVPESATRNDQVATALPKKKSGSSKSDLNATTVIKESKKKKAAARPPATQPTASEEPAAKPDVTPASNETQEGGGASNGSRPDAASVKPRQAPPPPDSPPPGTNAEAPKPVPFPRSTASKKSIVVAGGGGDAAGGGGSILDISSTPTLDIATPSGEGALSPESPVPSAGKWVDVGDGSLGPTSEDARLKENVVNDTPVLHIDSPARALGTTQHEKTEPPHRVASSSQIGVSPSKTSRKKGASPPPQSSQALQKQPAASTPDLYSSSIVNPASPQPSSLSATPNMSPRASLHEDKPLMQTSTSEGPATNVVNNTSSLRPKRPRNIHGILPVCGMLGAMFENHMLKMTFRAMSKTKGGADQRELKLVLFLGRCCRPLRRKLLREAIGQWSKATKEGGGDDTYVETQAYASEGVDGGSVDSDVRMSSRSNTQMAHSGVAALNCSSEQCAAAPYQFRHLERRKLLLNGPRTLFLLKANEELEIGRVHGTGALLVSLESVTNRAEDGSNSSTMGAKDPSAASANPLSSGAVVFDSASVFIAMESGKNGEGQWTTLNHRFPCVPGSMYSFWLVETHQHLNSKSKPQAAQGLTVEFAVVSTFDDGEVIRTSITSPIRIATPPAVPPRTSPPSSSHRSQRVASPATVIRHGAEALKYSSTLTPPLRPSPVHTHVPEDEGRGKVQYTLHEEKAASSTHMNGSVSRSRHHQHGSPATDLSDSLSAFGNARVGNNGGGDKRSSQQNGAQSGRSSASSRRGGQFTADVLKDESVSWVAYMDVNTGRPYYYHLDTGTISDAPTMVSASSQQPHMHVQSNTYNTSVQTSSYSNSVPPNNSRDTGSSLPRVYRRPSMPSAPEPAFHDSVARRPLEAPNSSLSESNMHTGEGSRRPERPLSPIQGPPHRKIKIQSGPPSTKYTSSPVGVGLPPLNTSIAAPDPYGLHASARNRISQRQQQTVGSAYGHSAAAAPPSPRSCTRDHERKEAIALEVLSSRPKSRSNSPRSRQESPRLTSAGTNYRPSNDRQHESRRHTTKKRNSVQHWTKY